MHYLKKSIKFLKHRWKCSRPCIARYSDFKPPWKILFFGTDSFSVSSLKLLCNEYRDGKLIQKLDVVTSSSNINPVRKYAKENNLDSYDWPLRLVNNQFDVGIVVSFGHLIPEHIIRMFPLGMINVHASLLPRWRGAAPIIYALANGDSKTGISIMKIEPKHFDIGKILSQVAVDIPCGMKMPELHKKLADIGAQDLLRCLHDLPDRLSKCSPQPSEGITYAPKIDPGFATVKWDSMSARQIYNLGRALISVYPLTTIWQNVSTKLFDIEEANESVHLDSSEPGFVQYHKPTRTLRVKCCDGNYVSIAKVGVLNKKLMSATDFNNGYLKKVPIQNRYFK